MAQEIPQGEVPVRHATVLDTGEQHLAKVYAQALLGATERAGNSDAVLIEFDSLIADVLDRLPKLNAVFASPRIGHGAKEQILDRAFGGRMSRELLNFLKVVSRHGRLGSLRAIHRAARERLNELRGRVAVQVRTAAPLDSAMMGQLKSRLSETLRRDVELQASVDPELIGGMVVRVGDTVYDGSVANQLKRMRSETVTRAGQAIRQAVERFALAD